MPTGTLFLKKAIPKTPYRQIHPTKRGRPANLQKRPLILLILCFNSPKETAAYYLEKAVTILNTLKQLPNDKFFGEQVDSYPIKTLSEGHISVLEHLDRKDEAKIFARTYYEAIDRLEKKDKTVQLTSTKEKLMKYVLNGTPITFDWR